MTTVVDNAYATFQDGKVEVTACDISDNSYITCWIQLCHTFLLFYISTTSGMYDSLLQQNPC